ncbi:MAG: pitrilysin family protein [Elusimicrobiota bacterium]
MKMDQKHKPLATRILALIQAAVLLLGSGLLQPLQASAVRVAAPQASAGQGGVAGAASSGGTQAGGISPVSLSPASLKLSGVLPALSAPALKPVSRTAGTAEGKASAEAVLPSGVARPAAGAARAARAAADSKASPEGAGTLRAASSARQAWKPSGIVSALRGLLLHGPKAGNAASVESLDGARRATERNFLNAAALGQLGGSEEGAVRTNTRWGRFSLKNPSLRRADAGSASQRGASSPASGKAPAANETYRELRLENGMHVQLVKNPGLFSATIAVSYGVGGRDDMDGEGGYAHFLEHLVHHGGTKRIRNMYRMLGAMGGYSNAFTYPDETVYVHTVRDDFLDLGIFLEAERMSNLEITPDKVEREKPIILEEKSSSDDSPYTSAWQRLRRLAFSNPNNGGEVLGSKGDIRGATAEKLRRYFDRHYAPEKAKVVISGNIDLDQTEKWVKEYLGAVSRRGPPAASARTDLAEAGQKSERRAEVSDPNGAGRAVLFAWRAPRHGTPAYYAASIAAEMLQDRLHRKLVLERKSAGGVSVSVPYLERDPASSSGAIDLGPEMTEDEALAALDKEIEAIRRGEFDAEELKRRIDDRVFALQNEMGDPYGGTLLLAKAAARGLSAADLKDEAERWHRLTAEDVSRAAAKFFTREKRSVVAVRPAPPAATKPAPTEDRHEAEAVPEEAPTKLEKDILEDIAAAKSPKVDFGTPEEFRLPNGLKVVVMPDGRRSTVYAKLAFREGATAADAAARMRVPLVAQLLGLRTSASSEQQVDDSLRDMGASIRTGQRWDHVVFDGNAPSESASRLLSLLSEMISRPYAWTQEELASWKALWKENLKHHRANPDVLGHQRALQDLVGSHPSAQSDLSEEAIDGLTPGEVARLARTHFAPDNAVLVVAGDVNPQMVKAELSRVFADWKPARQPAANGSEPAVNRQRGISLVDRPGSGQAQIRVSGIGIGDGRPSSEDHFPLLVASQLMGGGWSSRLFQVARRAMGVAYDAFSQVVTDKALAMWTFGLFTRPANVQPALKALLDQASSMRSRPPAAAELGSAKNALISSFLLSLDSIGGIADHLLGLELFDMPLASWGSYMTKVSEVTGKAVQRVAGKLLHPDKTAVTVVGDAERIEGDLAQERPVDVYDADGNLKRSVKPRSFFSRLFS